MRKKELIIGLGLGMVLASAVSLFPSSSGKTMTDEQVKKRATELGMIEKENANDVVLEKNAKATSGQSIIDMLTSSPETTEKAESSVEPTNMDFMNFVSKATEKPSESIKPTAKATDKVESSSEPTAKPTPEATKKAEKISSYVTVTIRAGMVSNQIATHFYELDLIDNTEKFDDFLCDNGYASDIRVGTFRIPKGATYKDIAEIITH